MEGREIINEKTYSKRKYGINRGTWLVRKKEDRTTEVQRLWSWKFEMRKNKHIKKRTSQQDYIKKRFSAFLK